MVWGVGCAGVVGKRAAQEWRIGALEREAMSVLRKRLKEPLELTLINVGVSSFIDVPPHTLHNAFSNASPRKASGEERPAQALSGLGAAGGQVAALATAARRDYVSVMLARKFRFFLVLRFLPLLEASFA